MVDESNSAIVVREANGQRPTLSQENISIPSPTANQVLVKLSHAAQNPTDIQAYDSNAFGDGAVLGCDFVGEVVELGSRVTRLAKGDIVAGLVWGGEIPGLGAYSQYCVADERISFRLPHSISREQASTVPLAAATAWLALFSKDCLGIDRAQANGTSILIWGGSSSVGQYAIQLATIYGMNVVTTCNPRHFGLARSYGAKYVFDYKDHQVVQRIQELKLGIQHVFDTIGNSTSSAAASRVFSTGPSHLCTVRPGKSNTEDVSPDTKVTDVLVWTAFLKDHSYGDFKWTASKDDHDLASDLFEKLPEWLENKTVKPNQPRILKGLHSVLEGFQEYREGKVSAYKIVYEL
ncbi:putative zinc-binding dehydrogenase family oxidoreductase [Aspergillus alliaceus]|uniref:Putative zinc-binding dehydrogenase family oxidoreductase n=1 Tax=Petromyces alliaceus TaxID=209559 RepID=A0A5N7CHH8_PETAA|nr:putative zinc-binding dehydrogenase family oxidoreductase [Aspergillus alliaceus]